MASSLVIKVADDVVQEWEMTGFKLAPILQYCHVPDEVANVVLESAGIEITGVAHDIAFIQSEEWEALIMTTLIEEAPLNLASKSRLRQFFAACRLVATYPEAEGPEAGTTEKGSATVPGAAPAGAPGQEAPPTPALTNEPAPVTHPPP